MQTVSKLEAWQRGPVAGIPPLLQPVAHALIQAGEEISSIMKDFPEELLWEKPAGLASAGFHLRHIAGVLDRLFTYAKDDKLNEVQFGQLRAEAEPHPHIVVAELLKSLQQQITVSLRYLETVDERSLTAPITFGRKELPSTVLGLLFHAAEHSMRHTGQLLVTVAILKQ